MQGERDESSVGIGKAVLSGGLGLKVVFLAPNEIDSLFFFGTIILAGGLAYVVNTSTR